MKKYIMPPLVLTIICVVISGLLVLVYNKTYVDTTGILTDQLKTGCTEIFGEDDYKILLENDTPVTFDTHGVISIITNKSGEKCLIELSQDGYSKGGLHLLIGVNTDNEVEGIYFLSNGETPGLGTKVEDKSFIDKLIGFSTETDENQIDNVTAATYSSKGMKAACKKAVTLYSEHKEAILGG